MTGETGKKKAWEVTQKRKGDNLPTSMSKWHAVNPSNFQATDSCALQTVSNGDESDQSDEDVEPPINVGLQGLKDIVKDTGEVVQKYHGKR